MNFKSLVAILLIITAVFGQSCTGTSDASLKSSVEESIANPTVIVLVKDGAVTLSGSVADESQKQAAEKVAKEVDGVKELTNLIVISPPKVDSTAIADDNSLKKGIDLLEKKFRSVHATLDSGVITLTGTVERDELPRVMQAYRALKPKSVENKLTIK